MPGAWAPSTSASTPRDRELAHQPLDREDEPGRAGHVVDQRQPRARADPREHRLDDARAPRAGTAGRHDDPRAGAGRRRRRARSGRRCRRGPWRAARRPARGRATGAPCWRRSSRSGRRRDRPGRRRRTPPSAPRASSRSPSSSRARNRTGSASRRSRRPPLRVQHRPGAGPEGAVVQEGDVGVERPEPAPAVGRGSSSSHDSPSSVTRPASSTGPERRRSRRPARGTGGQRPGVPRKGRCGPRSQAAGGARPRRDFACEGGSGTVKWREFAAPGRECASPAGFASRLWDHQPRSLNQPAQGGAA